MKNIKIVYGRNGSDIHRRIRSKVADFAAHASAEDRAFFIVPDQYTLTAERFLLASVGEKALRNIRVVSFKRLASLSFSEKGKTFDFVGEGGRAALVSAAFDAVSPQLKYYAGYSDFYFNEALCERIKMFKEYAVTPDMLLTAETSDAVHDLALVYGAYDALLGADRADPADNLRLFAELIAEHGLFRGATVFIDFFKVLNASELSVVRALYEAGAEINIGLVKDEASDDCGIFAPVLEVENKLRRFVEKDGGKLVYEKAENGTGYASNGLAQLEDFLATDGNSEPTDCDGVNIYEATDISDEVDFVCCRICELVLDCGYRFSDIAVVTRDDERYAPYFEKLFADYEIPFFRHKKSGLTEKKAVRFLSSLFSAIRFGFRADDVIDAVSCGYIDGINPTDLAEFERYVRIWNVNGKGFFEPFERSIRGFSGGESPSEEDTARLARAESVRLTVGEVLSYLGKGSETATVRTHAERLFSLFEKTGLEEKINADTQTLAAMGEKTLADENEKLFELLVRGLDEYVRSAGDSEVSFDLFGRMYLRIISEYSVGSIPTALDTVLVGGADTAPLLDKRAVFVLGLREGSFPKTPSSSPLVPERERAALEEQGIVVDISPFDKFLYEQFIAYYALTAATERVYMSYPSTDGGEGVPSEVFDRCRAAFPNAVITARASDAERIYRARPSKIKAVEYGIQDLSDYFDIRIASDDEYLRTGFSVSEEVAKKLYGSPVYISATKSDTFAGCPYNYFVRFGLGINELQKAEFSAVNVGSLVHASLDRIFKKEKDISALDDETLSALAQNEIGTYMKEAFGADADRRDMQACAASVQKRLLVLLRSMRNELRTVGFRPVYTELGIGKGENGLPAYDLDCGNGIKARVTGSIDRVDALEKDGKTFVRVIDYKTGKNKFSLADICRGKSLQLPLYLDILKETGAHLFSSEPEPAGMMYYVLNKETERLKPDPEMFAEFAQTGKLPAVPDSHKRSGMLLDVSSPSDGESVGEQTDIHGEVDKKEFIKTDKNGFDTVFFYVKDSLKKMCGTLCSGRTEKTPNKNGNTCKYCPLGSICEIRDNPPPTFRFDDPMKIMRDRMEKDGDDNG